MKQSTFFSSILTVALSLMLAFAWPAQADTGKVNYSAFVEKGFSASGSLIIAAAGLPIASTSSRNAERFYEAAKSEELRDFGGIFIFTVVLSVLALCLISIACALLNGTGILKRNFPPHVNFDGNRRKRFDPGDCG